MDYTNVRQDLQGQAYCRQRRAPPQPLSLEEAALVAKPASPWSSNTPAWHTGKVRPGSASSVPQATCIAAPNPYPAVEGRSSPGDAISPIRPSVAFAPCRLEVIWRTLSELFSISISIKLANKVKILADIERSEKFIPQSKLKWCPQQKKNDGQQGSKEYFKQKKWGDQITYLQEHLPSGRIIYYLYQLPTLGVSFF